MILQVAAKAIIINDKAEVLLVRKSSQYSDGPNAARYDFPGGRLEVGETYEEALKRETKEEVGLLVEPIRPIYIGEWRPVIKGQQYQIIGIFSLCKTENYDVKLDSENDEYVWLPLNQDTKLDLMAPARDLFNLLRQSDNALIGVN